MKMQHKLLNWCKALALPLVVWLVFVVLTKGRFAKPASVMNIFRTSVVPILLGMTLAFGMMMNMWNFASGAIVYACAIFGANLAKVTGTGIPGTVCVLDPDRPYTQHRHGTGLPLYAGALPGAFPRVCDVL